MAILSLNPSVDDSKSWQELANHKYAFNNLNWLNDRKNECVHCAIAFTVHEWSAGEGGGWCGLPLAPDSEPRPGSCRSQNPGSWCRPPPTAGWSQWESAAPAPFVSGPPGTEPSVTGADNCFKACFHLVLLDKALLHARADWRGSVVSLQTDFWKLPCTSECLSGQDDPPKRVETCLLTTQINKISLNSYLCQSTHLHVSIQLLE